MISVTETWLDSSVTDQEIAIENYCVIRKDRNRNGGGVYTYICSEIAFSIKNDISSEQDEILWTELYLPKTKPIIVGACYQPPKQNDLVDQFENNLSKRVIRL